MTLLPKYSAQNDRPPPTEEERERIAAKAAAASKAIETERLTRSQDWQGDPKYLRFREIAKAARKRA